MLQEVHFTTLLQIKIAEVFGVQNGEVSGIGWIHSPYPSQHQGKGVPSPSHDLF